MKRVVVLILCSVLALTVSGFTRAQANTAVPAAPVFTPTLAPWTSCGTSGGAQCSMLTVPLDYAHPDNGKTVKIAVSRVLADPTAGAYQGIMVVNPGGPGGSGLPFSSLQGVVPHGGGMTYDWIGFDPRGVGSSVPSLHCNSHYFGVDRPSFNPTTPRLMRYWVRKTNGYAAACGRSAARSLLPFMSTTDVVKDIESLRVAYQAGFNPLLDAAKIAQLDTLNFYGFSYGSYLGQVYATKYPNRVGKFVLDGVVDPTNYWYGANLQQEIFFDRNINIFFRWMAHHNNVFHLGTSGPNIRAGLNALLKQLVQHPLANGRLGPDELIDALLDAGYYVYNWPSIGAAYSDLVRHHHGRAMFDRYAAANQGDDNGYAVYNAVQCTDVYRPPFRVQMRDARRINSQHPFLAWDNTWYNAPCFQWPAPSHRRIYVTGASVTGKVLLINETLDAATPYSGALTLRGRFPTSRLIAGVGGTTHASSLSGVACVDDRIANFLKTGALPPRVSGRRADVNCPHVQPPPASGARTAYRTASRTAAGAMSGTLRSDLMFTQLVGLR